MKLDDYLTELKWRGTIAPRIIRVEDIIDHDGACYNVALFPLDMDCDSGVSYRIVTDDDEIKDRMELWPTQFVVLRSWTISNLVKGAMYMDRSTKDFFKSEVQYE